MRHLTGLCALFGLLLFASAARALPEYPGLIQAHLGLASPPTCNICHSSTAGGGPVSQPFGQAMQAAGLTRSADSLPGALDQLAADGTDSNGDGVPDIEGLKMGIEPLASKPPLKYGCGGARIAPGQPRAPQGVTFAVIGVLLLIRRRRGSGPDGRRCVR
jgi:hypothetical protein